jgi:hypothetical protein
MAADRIKLGALKSHYTKLVCYPPHHRLSLIVWKSTAHGSVLSKKTLSYFTFSIFNEAQTGDVLTRLALLSAGRRKLLLERVVLQETAEEEAREMMKPNPVEEYDTEYHGSFDIPNFVPSIDNFPKDSEVPLVGRIYHLYLV